MGSHDSVLAISARPRDVDADRFGCSFGCALLFLIISRPLKAAGLGRAGRAPMSDAAFDLPHPGHIYFAPLLITRPPNTGCSADNAFGRGFFLRRGFGHGWSSSPLFGFDRAGLCSSRAFMAASRRASSTAESCSAESRDAANSKIMAKTTAS